MKPKTESCQELITALGIMSGALPNFGGRQIEHELLMLTSLVDFFRAMPKGEKQACESFFPDELLEQASTWISAHYYNNRSVSIAPVSLSATLAISATSSKQESQEKQEAQDDADIFEVLECPSGYANLSPNECRHYLRFVLVPKAVHALAALLDRDITPDELDSRTSEENTALTNLCMALLDYTCTHHANFA